ncbi:MAG TPA: hypothetical protein PKL73_02530 [Polyangiaceae bacterium]|mgnify:CR=1 FL=1|jgi:hypothetical protein|nr:MAG: hypothetical protein BWY17_02808 [Deltaproteobacteria bacterium ADurb.Bin207]HNS95798.1 hypothetical protein [Polyangiaceae bacterium]HNZ24627.1 hypothetical protein [Polyangiaceae bacterium]HOD23241.1 hypothetical protein [Polyangiaceae bacterium]HOE51013.1 hypothetical protein [Polyangiaceae bacterium]
MTNTVRSLLLTRRGIVFVSSHGPRLPDSLLQALDLELSQLGYILSSRIRDRLSRCNLEELNEFRSWTITTLAAWLGADQKHKPLFRRFPRGIPSNTVELWWKKILVHYLQADGQTCLFCRRIGTTHVLDPCMHVVCDHCFDGSNYSACPICEHHVNRDSPFFRPTPERPLPSETIVFRLIDLGNDESVETKSLFVSLCERKQPLSPVDRDALFCIVKERPSQVLSWLPPTIAVRQNIAIVLGTLFSVCESSEVLPHAKRLVTTATDVLRLLAVLSGTDGSLMQETIFRSFANPDDSDELCVHTARRLGMSPSSLIKQKIKVPVRVHRFKVAKLPRPLRRALLGLLESLPADSLVEDMLRHRAYWVWVGEFLHPHEYASRFPNVARAFQIVRKKASDGTPAPRFRTWPSRLEQTLRTGDADAMLSVLSERPGEYARRFDFVLRQARDERAQRRYAEQLISKINVLSTPWLVAFRSYLPTRIDKAPIRVFWPKGRGAYGVSRPDTRTALPRPIIEPVIQAIDKELLARFGSKRAFAAGWIDEGLRTIMVPMQEATTSRSAVSLPRGSRVPLDRGRLIRLFLHWCEPAHGAWSTDLDLSVGLYDESWRYVGVCSYYELQAKGPDGSVIAQSAGDLRDAPWPDGATEFVDIHADRAQAASVRYVVMVVNRYGGMACSQLERCFAGLMLRDDPMGKHFDPRTVALKFALNSESGVFMPLVLDLRDRVLHWLDVQVAGQLERNNVETSNTAIQKICPEQMTYFASGVRPCLFDLGLLHAAARCRRVTLRGRNIVEFLRKPEESVNDFHARLVRGEGGVCRSAPADEQEPMFALLYRGDVELPEGSDVYALFREQLTPNLQASDLLS